jgi:hypothetical protein
MITDEKTSEPVTYKPGTCGAWSHSALEGGGYAPFIYGAGVLDRTVSSSAMLFMGPGLVIDGIVKITYPANAGPQSRVLIFEDSPETKSEFRRGKPRVAKMLAEVQKWSGWSDRKTGRMLGTTHPTVRRLAKDEVSPRSSMAIERLQGIHDILSRLSVLVGASGDLKGLLGQTDDAGLSVEDYLEQGRLGAGYRAGLRLISGARPQMLGGSSTSALPATYPLGHDDWV